MTREEAIERLKTDIYKYADFTENPNENEFWMAFDMAIKALEQEPTDDATLKDIFCMGCEYKEQEPCEDCISRQAVIDACDQSINLFEAVDRIKELPPVTPQPKTGHWIDDEFGSKCSCCGIYTHLDKFERPMKFKCCSMCGAKMIEPQESER